MKLCAQPIFAKICHMFVNPIVDLSPYIQVCRHICTHTYIHVHAHVRLRMHPNTCQFLPPKINRQKEDNKPVSRNSNCNKNYNKHLYNLCPTFVRASSGINNIKLYII